MDCGDTPAYIWRSFFGCSGQHIVICFVVDSAGRDSTFLFSAYRLVRTHKYEFTIETANFVEWHAILLSIIVTNSLLWQEESHLKLHSTVLNGTINRVSHLVIKVKEIVFRWEK